jgi:hypothetical protein
LFRFGVQESNQTPVANAEDGKKKGAKETGDKWGGRARDVNSKKGQGKKASGGGGGGGGRRIDIGKRIEFAD